MISFQVRSGQIKSECLTCSFRASCCSARLSRAHILVPLSGTEKKGAGVRGAACTDGYKGVRAVRPQSVTSGGWFEVLWNLQCPVGLSQRGICAHFNEGNLAQFGPSAEKFRIVELRSEILI